MKYPCLSKESKELYKDLKAKFRIISILPLDKPDCDCKDLIANYHQNSASGKSSTDIITCPRTKKTGYKKYLITCNNCKNPVAEVYAKDASLQDYCNLHYICETDGKFWYGCMALNLSPIDGSIGIECSCGQDTRDFRANNTLPKTKLDSIIAVTSIGREFSKKDSKFTVTEQKD